MTSIKESAMWTDWATAGKNELQMSQLIHRIIKQYK
jgi:hypothetical protein